MGLNSLDVGGRRAVYWRSDSDTRPGSRPVVLLHGLAADHRGLLPLADCLPGIDAVALDLPGCGGSEPLADRHTVARYADAVEAVCECIGLGPVTVIGHSLGGRISLALAARHPARIRAQVLFNPV